MAPYLTLVLFLYLSLGTSGANCEIQCRDESGNPVDWYIGYKFPQLEHNDKFESGYAYAYATSNQLTDNPKHEQKKSSTIYSRLVNLFLKSAPWRKRSQNGSIGLVSNQTVNKWTLSDHKINEPGSCVSKTLEVAYSSSVVSSEVSSIYYNDQPPVDSLGKLKRSGIKAHAKGVLLMDNSGENGLWLTHSIPLFPTRRDTKFEFHENSRRFGQTFMCISLDFKRYGKQVIQHLINMRPLVYDYKISDDIKKLIPEIESLTTGKKAPITAKLAQTITTKSGKSLNLYSKSTDFKQDMYANWIDAELGTALFVETWRQGKGTPLNSTCPSNAYHVNNIKDLKYDKSTTWSYLHDHSKWAISDEASQGILCIGDSNRMKSQFKRGGGAVCIKCSSCWALFSNTILDIEPCPRNASNSSVNRSNNNNSI